MARKAFIHDYENFVTTSDFLWREEYLSSLYDEVCPRAFYEDLFPPGTIATYISKADVEQGKGLPDIENKKPCPIVSYQIDNTMVGEKIVIKENYSHGSHRQKIMFNDYKALDMTCNNRFTLCNAITYSGKRRTNKNAYACHGFIIDLDGVKEEQIRLYVMGIENGILPKPTYIVNSGHGVHIYFMFESAVPLFRKTARYLDEIKRHLTYYVWTRETSNLDKMQIQGIYQAFRMVGSWSKFGMKNKNRTKYIIKAFKCGDKVNLYELCNNWLRDVVSSEVLEWLDNRDYSSCMEEHISLEQAKELYPSWYDRIVVKGLEKGSYQQNEGLYNWWIDIVRDEEEAFEGNRYFCCCIIFAMAHKVGFSKEKAYQDCLDLLEYFNSLTLHPDNEFTIEDIKSASKFYDDYLSIKLSNKGIYNLSKINTKPYIKSRRNGRTQKEHLKRAGYLRTLSSYENVGRPSKQEIVENYYKDNPSASVRKAAADLGIGKSTVARWRP